MIRLSLIVFVVFWENTTSNKILVSKCNTSNGVEGYCRPSEECVGASQTEVSNCTDGMICCLRGATSQRKCYKYAEYVFSSDTGMTLMATTKTSKKQDTCAIVATPLIVGGEPTQPMEFPHQAVFGYDQPKKPSKLWECGGSLISENFVLTAAHCVLPDHLPKAVRFGITNLEDDNDDEQIYDIENITIHPKYHRLERLYDIALVKLAQDVEFTPSVRPACLDYIGEIKESRAIATGFGLTAHAGEQSKNLLKVTLDILDKKDCYRTVRRNIKSGLQNTQICAGVLSGGKDTCQGDSGGPLQTIKQVPYCMYNIIGVTSYGAMCGFEYSPAVYTRVWSFVPWIESIVWPEQ